MGFFLEHEVGWEGCEDESGWAGGTDKYDQTILYENLNELVKFY